MLWKMTKITISLAQFASKWCLTLNSALSVKQHIVRTASTNGTKSKTVAQQLPVKMLTTSTYIEWSNRPWTKEDSSVQCQDARSMLPPTRVKLKRGRSCSHSRLDWHTPRLSSIKKRVIIKLMLADWAAGLKYWSCKLQIMKKCAQSFKNSAQNATFRMNRILQDLLITIAFVTWKREIRN